MWDKFVTMLETAKLEKERTGKAPIVSRFDVVPMAEHLRQHLSNKEQMEVRADTAQSMVDFKAEEVINWNSPRPVMFIQGADDTVTPSEQRTEERSGGEESVGTVRTGRWREQ